MASLQTIILRGELPCSKEPSPIDIEYVGREQTFSAHARIALQGDSTLDWPKKNYIIEMDCEKEFSSWGSHNSFILKAEYHDILHARNVVSAKLWGKMKSDSPGPELLRQTPNRGAIDGFPVKVYHDNDYLGIYCLTTPKAPWLFGMDPSNSKHVVIEAAINDRHREKLKNTPCNFNCHWDGSSEYFTFNAGRPLENIISSFNNIVDCALAYYQCHSREEEDCLKKLNEVLDVNSLVDYFVFQDIIAGTDGLAKNLTLVTYDAAKWFAVPYDLDATFGMEYDGVMVADPTAEIGDGWFMNKYSLLLQLTKCKVLLRRLYLGRYLDLRKGALSTESIMSEFNRFYDLIGAENYREDAALYIDHPNNVADAKETLRKFVDDRLTFLDERYKMYYDYLTGDNK